MFTILLFIALLSPYILSYSSGVQIFSYRQTFRNSKCCTTKSFLLTLYLFPTGIIYFIVVDIVNILLTLYFFFAFGCFPKIQSRDEVVQIESKVAKYFGMSRMDWISIKKQQSIAQVLLSIYICFYSDFFGLSSKTYNYLTI